MGGASAATSWGCGCGGSGGRGACRGRGAAVQGHQLVQLAGGLTARLEERRQGQGLRLRRRRQLWRVAAQLWRAGYKPRKGLRLLDSLDSDAAAAHAWPCLCRAPLQLRRPWQCWQGWRRQASAQPTADLLQRALVVCLLGCVAAPLPAPHGGRDAGAAAVGAQACAARAHGGLPKLLGIGVGSSGRWAQQREARLHLWAAGLLRLGGL